jgi:hypothetical protein
MPGFGCFTTSANGTAVTASLLRSPWMRMVPVHTSSPWFSSMRLALCS